MSSNHDSPQAGSGVSDGNASRSLDPIKHRRSEDPEDDTQCQQYLQELHVIRLLLISMMAVIRRGSKEEVVGLLECIRGGASLSEIRSHLLSLDTSPQATWTTIPEDEAIKDAAEEE